MADSDFVDHYEVLQISPNAQAETIQRVHRLLAQLYHPDNKETGDQSLFEQVLTAYRMSSDPGEPRRIRCRAQSRVRFEVEDLRSAVRYSWDRGREAKTTWHPIVIVHEANELTQFATLTIVELEQLLGCAREHLEMSLWYLSGTGQVQRGDSGRYALTVKGFEALEEQSENKPARSSV